jgi:hypothetical protein
MERDGRSAVAAVSLRQQLRRHNQIGARSLTLPRNGGHDPKIRAKKQVFEGAEKWTRSAQVEYGPISMALWAVWTMTQPTGDSMLWSRNARCA